MQVIERLGAHIGEVNASKGVKGGPPLVSASQGPRGYPAHHQRLLAFSEMTNQQQLPSTDPHQKRVANRLPAETFDLILGESYPCRVSLARDPETGAPVEIVLKPSGSAGKSGGSLDLIMFDLGVCISRALQGRNPRDGKKT